MRALVELSAALARGTRGEWRGAMTRALASATAAEVEETILQSYLFLGYPAALQALGVWRDLQPDPASVEGPGDPEQWRKRGNEVFEIVYGHSYDKLTENVTQLHPDLVNWMLTEGYGKVLARPALDLKTRELCIVALLAPQDAIQQLHSHLRGALNAGATITEVDDAVASAISSAPRERAQAARTLWAELRSKRTATNADRGSGIEDRGTDQARH